MSVKSKKNKKMNLTVSDADIFKNTMIPSFHHNFSYHGALPGYMGSPDQSYMSSPEAAFMGHQYNSRVGMGSMGSMAPMGSMATSSAHNHAHGNHNALYNNALSKFPAHLQSSYSSMGGYSPNLLSGMSFPSSGMLALG